MRPDLLGIHGVAGAGKDTTFDRLRELGGPAFQRFSIADPMKESIAALFGVSLAHLEHLKRDPQAFVELRGSVSEQGTKKQLGTELYRVSDLSMREFMQRYGTEAHRGIFGEEFWLEFWLQQVDARQHLVKAVMGEPCTFVNTSVRFVNEAESILGRGGEVWQIVGPQDEGAAGHESETPLPPHLVTRYIDNSIRAPYMGEGQAVDGKVVPAPNFNHLDDQLALILSEWNDA